MLFLITYTLIEYLNVYLAYRIILNAKLQKKAWVYIVTLVVPCILQAAFINKTDYDWQDILIIGTGFFAISIWAENKKIKYVLLFPLVYIGTSVINTLGSYFYSFVIHKTEFEIIKTPIYILLSECTAILIMIIVGLWKKRRNVFQEEYEINVKQYIIWLVGLLNFIVIMSVAQALEYKDYFTEKERHAFGFAAVCVVLLFIILNIWQQITLKHEQEYRLKNEAYEHYIRLQEEHIRRLIERDEDMRRFRHDFHAHITALEAYAEKNHDTGMQSYIENMKDASALYVVQKYTGITAVDAVISEQIYSIKEQKIAVKWEGTVSSYDKISLFDLCTIFSNLLSNAIEACGKQGNKKSEIYVNTYCYEEKLYLDIKNPVDLEDQKAERMETTKLDKKNHGFGIRNVQDTVKKYGGSMECCIKSGWFEVEILI